MSAQFLRNKFTFEYDKKGNLKTCISPYDNTRTSEKIKWYSCYVPKKRKGINVFFSKFVAN